MPSRRMVQMRATLFAHIGDALYRGEFVRREPDQLTEEDRKSVIVTTPVEGFDHGRWHLGVIRHRGSSRTR